MFDNPIENIMSNTLSKLKSLVEVNNVVGKPMLSADGLHTIIPISKLSMGFLVGGGEYNDDKKTENYPYAGATGAGVSVTPVGFLVCNGASHKLIKLDGGTDKMADVLTALINSLGE